jgi:ribosomal protein L29
MKRNDIKMLHQKTIPELVSMQRQLEEEILRVSIGMEKTKNLREIHNKKTDIARILSIIQELKTIQMPAKEEKKHA